MHPLIFAQISLQFSIIILSNNANLTLHSLRQYSLQISPAPRLSFPLYIRFSSVIVVRDYIIRDCCRGKGALRSLSKRLWKQW